MYEYLVTENRAGWQPWRERVPSWKYPRTQARAFFPAHSWSSAGCNALHGPCSCTAQPSKWVWCLTRPKLLDLFHFQTFQAKLSVRLMHTIPGT